MRVWKNCYFWREVFIRMPILNLETESKRKNVGYCRVSTQRQKQNLENQKEFVSVYSLSHGVILDEIYTDIGSGLNYKRKNLIKLRAIIKTHFYKGGKRGEIFKFKAFLQGACIFVASLFYPACRSLL